MLHNCLCSGKMITHYTNVTNSGGKQSKIVLHYTMQRDEYVA